MVNNLLEFSKIKKGLEGLDEVPAIALAVSGGADSMYLAYMCKNLLEESHLKIICLIVDHKLRVESTEEANFVKQQLESHGLKAEVLTWSTDKPKSNIHSIAREARYSLLIDYCKKHDISHLLTAHTYNDQAETILMRILRGTGVDGLCGIPFESIIQGIKLIRPLLCVKRSEIEGTLKSAGWIWVDDPSNKNTKYERVKIRNYLAQLPESSLAIQRLNLLGKNSRRVRSCLNSMLSEAYTKLCVEGRFKDITLKLDGFINLDEEIALRLLSQALKKTSGKHYPPRLESLEKLYDEIKHKEHFKKTLWGCEIHLKHGDIHIFRELREVEEKKRLVPNQDNYWDNRYKVNTTEEGLYIGALGVVGLKMLKQYIKKNIGPAKLLYTTPAIFGNNNELIYYPPLEISFKNDKPIKLYIEPLNKL
jgi:tRNA(Ile)-lysidine synthase